MLRGILYLLACAVFASAESERVSSEVPLLNIPETRQKLESEAKLIRTELADLPDFTDTRQIDAYGFHGDHLPILDVMPESPRWTVTVSWRKGAKIEQVILVPAIDPRSRKMRGYGFPRRFRVSKVFPDGSTEVVAEQMEEDCPAPAHVPLRIDIPEPRSASVRIEVFRGVEEGGMEVFALGEVLGVVGGEIWQGKGVKASPAFVSFPYWGGKYLVDQKTGLGMPLGSEVENHEAEVSRDFSVVFEESPLGRCFIDIDLGSTKRMGWLTLLPAKPPRGSIVPGYGFPKIIKLFVGRTVGETTVFTPCRDVSYKGNPGDNAIRIPLDGFEGRWLRLSVSQFAKHNGQEIFALGEATISKRVEIYPVQAIRLKGFPEGAELLTAPLTDGLVGGRPALQIMEWFELIERQNWLGIRLDQIALADRTMERRWVQARERVLKISGTLLLLALTAWLIRRRLSMQRLRLRIVQEQHHTEVEQMKLRFFTHISHELRTPLSVIPAPIERAMKQVGEGKLRTYLSVALKNVYELQKLVEELLDLRQIQDGKMRITRVEMDLVDHVQQIIDSMRPLAEEKGTHLRFDPAVKKLVVPFDPEALKRILGNLVNNAIKFTLPGGRVVVGLSTVGQKVVFFVEDTGPGIANEDLSNIFEQHYRGQSSSATHGSGIGLALVKEVVELLGGKVQVVSPISDGHGSRFTVELPIKEGANDE